VKERAFEKAHIEKQQVIPNPVSKLYRFDFGFAAGMNSDVFDRLTRHRHNHRDFCTSSHFGSGIKLGQSVLQLKNGAVKDTYVFERFQNVTRKTARTQTLDEFLQYLSQKGNKPVIESVEDRADLTNSLSNFQPVTPAKSKPLEGYGFIGSFRLVEGSDSRPKQARRFADSGPDTPAATNS